MDRFAVNSSTERILYSYSTEHLLKKDKVRFYYALKGRDGKSGIVKSYEIEHLGRAVLLVPAEHSNDVKDFLELWKCRFSSKRIIVGEEGDNAIYNYSTKHLEKKDKVRFYYALNGRDGKSGIIKSYGIEHIGRGVLLVPGKFINDVKEYLELWKCEYKIRRVTVKE